MKILVINTGSSSIKYRFFDMERQAVLASGVAEKIGEAEGMLTHKRLGEQGKDVSQTKQGVIADHRQGLTMIVECLVDKACGVIGHASEIDAVGHRVVHGGETFKSSVIIDAAVVKAVRKNIPLAPLHNPSNLTGIEVAQSMFPHAPQVAVFDTAFHQTIPRKAYLYALPFALYERQGVRRYGFHGTSHAYVADRSARYLGRPLDALNMITVHLGNGASMAAIERGRCVDTSMGMTPLEGLVMGTRSGDVDPALPFFLADHLHMSLKAIDRLLNQESGLAGLCGTNDMREVMKARAAGDEHAEIALEVYCYRIKKYIGAYYAVLGSLDALVFTGGIGENAADVRALSCRGLERMGIALDAEANRRSPDRTGPEGIREISPPDGAVKVLVVPTNEELRIAQETMRVIVKRDGR